MHKVSTERHLFNNSTLEVTTGIVVYSCYCLEILASNYKFITTSDFSKGANPMSAGLPAIPTLILRDFLQFLLPSNRISREYLEISDA